MLHRILKGKAYDRNPGLFLCFVYKIKIARGVGKISGKMQFTEGVIHGNKRFDIEKLAGYVFLYYKCRWGWLAGHNIPGIVDLFVFEKYRRKKIATLLLDAAENIAGQHCNKIYLDVCLNSGYGPAQRFYIKRGYIPDGKGVYYKEKICEADVAYRNDDELTTMVVFEGVNRTCPFLLSTSVLLRQYGQYQHENRFYLVNIAARLSSQYHLPEVINYSFRNSLYIVAD